VMSEPKDKAVEEQKPPGPQAVEEQKPPGPPKKPPGYRSFERLLKNVIKAPPMRTVRGASKQDT
jgi:hypothetical protein